MTQENFRADPTRATAVTPGPVGAKAECARSQAADNRPWTNEECVAYHSLQTWFWRLRDYGPLIVVVILVICVLTQVTQEGRQRRLLAAQAAAASQPQGTTTTAEGEH